jgi:hypothetical protein
MFNPREHTPDCDFHVDQYPWECSCGLKEKSMPPVKEPDFGPAVGSIAFEGDRVTISMSKDDWEREYGVVTKLRQRVLDLEDALQELADEQNGPPLIRREKEWGEAMEKARKVLGEAS